MIRLLKVLGIVVLSGVILISCAPSPETSPVVKKRFRQIDDLAERITVLEEKVDTLSSDVKAAYDDLVDLKKQAPGISPEEKAKVTKLDKEVKKLANTVEELEKNVKNLASAPALKKEKPEVEPPKKPTIEVKKEERVVSPDTYAIPKGFYYTVKSGDTLEGIAQKHNLSKEQLLQANNLPANATLYAGQQLFIPAKKK